MSVGRIALEVRMLSGEPFTYGGLCAAFPELEEGRSRAIDSTIQRMRRQGLISFVREGRQTVWTAKSANT